MRINFEKYRDKVNACWVGKNIGGTMGTPYEGTREYLDIKGFKTKPGEVLPNDDLDLQLVWLLALERSGPKNISAALLGEYWMSFITPYWNEYGIGKCNMSRGLLAPTSGDFRNSWRDSNGAWIRTEIWACSVPGNPCAAAKYAVEDAKVDHGAGEGTYAASFVAGMQSSAFVLSDIRKCIDVGLATIPEDCRVAKSVKFVMDAYDRGMSARETRDAVQKMNSDIGDGWFEAPSNVAYTVLGLIWGEGDFKKSMITAINCGDDTDCTGATVGATLGILNGMAGIPDDWREYLGDDIVTISIARGMTARRVPETCTKLTERVVRLAPSVLFANYEIGIDGERTDVALTYGEEQIPEDVYDFQLWMARRAYNKIKLLKPYTLSFSAVGYTVDISLSAEPVIKPEGTIGLRIRFANKCHLHDNIPMALSLRWLVPEGFEVEGEKNVNLPNWNSHSIGAYAIAEATVRTPAEVPALSRIVLEVSIAGRADVLYCPITLLG